MEFIAQLPVWLLIAAVFLLRVTDVSLGTVRTLAIVEGRATIAVCLGFFEVGIWITAVSQVISRLHESPFLILAYASGFAAGNAVGLLIERRMAIGSNVIRIFSHKAGREIARALRDKGRVLTTFDGEGRDGPVTLLYVSCSRRDTEEVVQLARALDPDIFYNVERAQASVRTDLRQPNGRGLALSGTLRSILKKK